MNKLLVCILLVLLGTQISAQEIDKGYKAYNDGDYATALKEWKPLAEQGYAFAQYNLGILYEYGNGVPKDYAEAVKWYRLSSEQGYAISQYSLGLMYSNGYGVLKDKAEAVKWWRLSAEQGYVYAQGMLGIMYELGEGVLKDNIIAHMWYNIASNNGHESAGDWRDGRASFMSASDIKKATDMANKCMESDYKKCGY
ncbi:sel1 repeat family protein [Amylibacter sp.]|jgi:TPR repeat protein|nr:sel1 repeat family protein [Amylibacter sp.]